MNSDIYFKYFYYHTKHIPKRKIQLKTVYKYIMGAGRSPANYGFGHLPDFEESRVKRKNTVFLPQSVIVERV